MIPTRFVEVYKFVSNPERKGKGRTGPVELSEATEAEPIFGGPRFFKSKLGWSMHCGGGGRSARSEVDFTGESGACEDVVDGAALKMSSVFEGSLVLLR